MSNHQRLKEGTFCASELAGIEPTPPAPKGAGYVRLDHSATGGMKYIYLRGYKKSCVCTGLNFLVFIILRIEMRSRYEGVNQADYRNAGESNVCLQDPRQ